MELINLLRCEGKLGDDVRIGGVAIERIRLCGDIEAVFLAEAVEIILHMQAVHALGRAVDMVIRAAVMAVDGEAVFEIMAHLCSAQGAVLKFVVVMYNAYYFCIKTRI